MIQSKRNARENDWNWRETRIDKNRERVRERGKNERKSEREGREHERIEVRSG